ncbi:beta-eliminating lyase-related protein [Pontimonas sp.]|uniref:threonine aldolase family protein n=1 Tax=Pontimonas sp. TaxID=2304492 RepID=UPI002870840B|nr:beta-eliminating lyase-related protein [Pontimonas sp.]MDR9434969.1 beta-eliminating lyase-related protein [Pontimonas sp.]
MTTPAHTRSFASDNAAGVHPLVLRALEDANGGHQTSYGRDDVTSRLAGTIRAQFGERAEVFPVFNGTGANVIALTAAMPRWGGVIATHSAHINTDEGGAPERVSGLKLLTTPAVDGKLTPEGLLSQAGGRGDEHHAQPLAVSITQSSELGTVYTPEEIRTLAGLAHERGMVLHVDGARLWNAAASLGASFREFTTDVGVDLVSLGATKNGVMAAEAVVVINPDAVEGMAYLRKMSMQLASKMRFISAQIQALFDDGLGLELARHANAMAALLRSRLDDAIAHGQLGGLSFSHATQANALFAVLDNAAADQLRQSHQFYDWDRAAGEVRWMCAFDTTEDDIEQFIADIHTVLGR